VPRIIHCQGCKEEKEHCAKGLCLPCYKRKNYQEHKEHRKALVRKWSHKHREERRLYKNQYRCQEKVKARRRKYRCDNRAARSAYMNRYYHKNREVMMAHVARYHARKLGAFISDFTDEDWQIALDYYDYKCAYCGTQDKPLAREHIIPLSRGGPHTISNIVPACQSCNSRKGACTPSEVQMYLWRLPLTKFCDVFISSKRRVVQVTKACGGMD